MIPTVLGFSSHQVCFIDKPKPVDVAQAQCLATMIYGEARGEPLAGQIAVAYTAVNRAKKKSVCQIVLAPKQYSIFNNNDSLKTVALTKGLQPCTKNKIEKSAWEKAKTVAQLVLSRSIKDPTNGATHYLAYKKVKRFPKWAIQYAMVSHIENHKFFVKA